jgi:hypothetical protein
MADGSAYKCTPRISLSTRAFSSRNDPEPFGNICGAAQAVSALLPHRNHDRSTSLNEWILSTITSIPVVRTGSFHSSFDLFHESVHSSTHGKNSVVNFPGPIVLLLFGTNYHRSHRTGFDDNGIGCAKTFSQFEAFSNFPHPESGRCIISV